MRRLLLLGGVALALASSWQPAAAQDAAAVLKAMSNYMAAQKDFAFKYDTSIEVVTSDVQKLQFDSSGEIVVSRPDRAKVTRTGGYADVEFIADGKTASLLGRNLNIYAQVDFAGPLEALVDRLRRDHGTDLPAADLLAADPASALMEGVIEAKHVGRGVVGGIECDHLAFRNEDVDWQLWVEVGPQPVPRKYVITSKALAAAPQYTIVTRDWRTGATPSADAFVFRPPADARKVDLDALRGIDEIPPGAEYRK